MKILYVNCGLRNAYESDLLSYEHHSSSSESKAWNKLRLVWDLNPWTLRYLCSDLLTELTSQVRAGQYFGS